MSHTPGPWIWINPDDDKPLEVFLGYGSLRTVEHFKSGNFNLPKFIIDVEEFGRDLDENKSNAYLLQSAPDLLAALERLVAYGDVFRYYEWETNPYQDAKAAIAKAKGKD